VSKGLLIEGGGGPEDSISNEEDIGYDEFCENTMDEEIVYGNNGPLLVVCRACFAPRASEGDGWLRTNIFRLHVPSKRRFAR
jgi:hypothetical protein